MFMFVLFFPSTRLHFCSLVAVAAVFLSFFNLSLADEIKMLKVVNFGAVFLLQIRLDICNISNQIRMSACDKKLLRK